MGDRKKEQKLSVHLDRYFRKLESKLGAQSSVQIIVHSDKLGISYRYPADSGDRPYHIASVGKVFTATLVFRLIERGMVALDGAISGYLPRELLEGLFVYQGVDHAEKVTVKELLAHTSGVADYFDDPVSSGMPFIKEVVNHPDTFWTPEALLDFSRRRQQAVGRPGAGFHYSDTGYILLGLLIEKVTGRTFQENLHDELFRPLEMRDSYLMLRSEPANQPGKQIQKFWAFGTEASTFRSLSCDWAGGGIVSTTEDLLKFQSTLRKGSLVGEKTLQSMETCPHKFRPGIYYGLGMMEIHFGDFFFLLKMLPRVTGHIGILSTHMFYDKTKEAHIIMNFGNTAHMTASFKALIEIMNALRREGPLLRNSDWRRN